MRIACYLDAQGRPASLYRSGRVHLFEEVDGRWRECGRFAFHLDHGMSLAAVKDALARLAAALDPGCRVLLSDEVRGLPYSLLQEQYGFRVWKSDGALEQQLAEVREHEDRARARRKYEIVLRASQPVPSPVRLADGRPGHYWIDLRAALEHHSNPTSRNILIPFLAAGQFVKLEVLCDHLPKWMAWELERMDLSAESEPVDATGAGLRVSIHSRKSPEGRMRPPGLADGARVLCLPCPRERGSGNALPLSRPLESLDWQRLPAEPAGAPPEG